MCMLVWAFARRTYHIVGNLMSWLILSFNEQWQVISNNVVCATSKGSDQPVHMAVWSEPLLVAWTSMTVQLLTEHHLKFLGLKEGCIGSSESTLVKITTCWKPHVMVQIILYKIVILLNFESVWPTFLSIKWKILHECSSCCRYIEVLTWVLTFYWIY